MIRVLHYVGKMDRGGMETFIMNIYRNIDRNKVQFDFAVHGNRNGDYETEILNMGGRFYRFPPMRKGPVYYKKRWRNFFKEHGTEYGVFHMHTNSLANIIALQEAANAHIPIRIVHAHSSYANKGKLQWMNNLLHKYHQSNLDKYATNLFACSDKAAEWLFGGECCKGIKVQLIKNGINTSKYVVNETIRRKMREELGVSGCKVIGHVGTFLPVKNHSFLIEIIESLYRRDNSIRGILIGDGALINEVKNNVKEKGLENVILFTGSRDDVNKLLMAMDLFIMPSKYEGLPVSLVEAQASGLPILASDTITKDVCINSNMEYYSLNMGSEKWADKAWDMLRSQKRCLSAEKIIAAGFDIAETVDLYMKIIGELNYGIN